MADLFTDLAGEESISQAVQPRLKSRFEDGGFASGGFQEDTQTLDDHQTAGQAAGPAGRYEPFEHPEPPGSAAPAAIETIRESLPPLDPALRRTQPDYILPPARVTPAPLEAAPQITTEPQTTIIDARAIASSGVTDPVIAPVQPPEAATREAPRIMPTVENAIPDAAQPSPIWRR